jgi:hypothetical protein
MPTSKPAQDSLKVKLLLILWGILVAWLGSIAEDYVRKLKDQGMAEDRAKAIALVVEMLEVLLAGPWGKAIVRSIAVHIAIPAVAKIFPNDPSTGTWGAA